MSQLLENSLLQKVERIEAFEARMKIRLENISIRIGRRNYITLFCEVYPLIGTSIQETIGIECVIYDIDGKILDRQIDSFVPSEFFGFKVVDFNFSGDELGEKIGKIRIYPIKR